MERRKCRRCGHPMTRMLTNDAGRWSACYTCLSCGYETATVTAKSETAAEDGLERFMDRVDRAHEDDRRSAAPTKPDKLVKVYDLYCQLCETLTGKPIAKLDELLTAALHRAEPETRLLTLDEIYAKIDDEDWNVVWIEVPYSQKAEPMCPFYKEENKIVFCAPPFFRVWQETISRYGKSWRCWTQKPTPEQMAAEKWEE